MSVFYQELDYEWPTTPSAFADVYEKIMGRYDEYRERLAVIEAERLECRICHETSDTVKFYNYDQRTCKGCRLEASRKYRKRRDGSYYASR